MSDRSITDGELDALLGATLREIPAPAVTPDFDDRVLASIRRRQPWWSELISTFALGFRPAPARGRSIVSALRFVPIAGFVATLGTAATLLAVPATRWMIMESSGFGGNRSGLPAVAREYDSYGSTRDVTSIDSDRRTEIADRIGPNDFGVQLAAAASRFSARKASQANPQATGREYDGMSMGDELRPLESRFHDDPAFYANLIRADTQHRIRIRREDDLKWYYRTSAKDPADTYVVRKTDLDRYLADCRRGEELEPQNGYFPMMKAAALISVGRDQEAFAAFHEASGLTDWDPHFEHESEGRWRLNRAAEGEQSAVHFLLDRDASNRSDTWTIRTAYYVAAAIAIRSENGGDKPRGLAIRQDLVRCGSLVRRKAPLMQYSGMAAGFFAAAATKPGGKPAPKAPGGYETRESLDHRFARYLEDAGHKKEAVEFLVESSLANRADEVVRKSFDGESSTEAAAIRLSARRLLNTALLSCAMWLTIFGLAGSFYLGRVRKRELAGWAREDVFVAGIGGATALGVAAMAAWHQSAALFGQGWTAVSMGAIAQGYGPRALSDSVDIRAAAFLVVLALPTLIVVISAAAGIIRKRPALATVAGGLRSVGWTLAALLILVYAFLMPGTLQQEDDLHRAIVEMDQRDWNKIAESSGGEWMRVGL